MIFFRPKSGFGISFGVCVPAVCSFDLLQQKFNKTINEQVSIKLLHDSCQLEEQMTAIKSVDWATM